MKIIRVDGYDEICNAFSYMKDTFSDLSKRVNMEEYSHKIARYGDAFIIVEDQVCGFAAIYTNNVETKIAYITLIGIRKEFRRMNLGSKLFIHCVNKAKENGMKFIKLEVNKTNISAIKFYEKLGMFIVSDASDFSYYMEMEI